MISITCITCLAILLCPCAAWGTPLPPGRLQVPEYDINLDLEPEERFKHVYSDFALPLDNFAKFLHAKSFVTRFLAKLLSDRRGSEPYEMQREMAGWAKLMGVSVEEIHFMNMLYELSSLTVIPIVNLTGPIHHLQRDDLDLIKMLESMNMLENAGEPQDLTMTAAPIALRFGCTGIIAINDDDGTVYHARNLDFSLAKYLQPLIYTGIFMKKGKEIFRAQTVASISFIITGMRKGLDGYTIELNTRYPDHLGGFGEMWNNLFRTKKGGNKADLSGWTKRKVLENIDNYDGAVKAFSTTPYVATEYNIVAGVKKGVILARNPDGCAYKLPLNETEKKYIIMTNYDYPWHDIRENFDMRRQSAVKILDQVEVFTPELLFNVLNEDHVMAKDTMFQVIMNIETGLWNASLPSCKSCGRGAYMLRQETYI